MSAEPRGRRALTVLVVSASAAVTGWLVGSVFAALSGGSETRWVLGRAAGICSYLLLLALVLTGILLSHPWRARWRRPSSATRIRIHIGLATFTLAFLGLHVVVLATDEYAHVGWTGAFVPMTSEFRPVAVTLGTVALYAGVLAGVTAAFAGSWAARLWWPVHKVAAVVLLLTWTHGVLAGTDTGALLWLYVGSAVLVGAAAWSRYVARRPADRVGELVRERAL